MKLRELLEILKRVQEETGASIPFIVGGTPRDKFIGDLKKISDIDVSTGDASVFDLAPNYAQELQKTMNVSVKKSSDGHSTLLIGNLKMDFSSHFICPSVDQELTQKGIKNPTEMQREVFSRDFTCNSLLLSLDLQTLHDPTKSGFKDIKAKIIRTCLSPEITLTSNKNRVIRSIYLAAKLDFEIDQSIIDYVSAHPESARISTEKVMAEKLNQAFDFDAHKTSRYLTQMNLWNEITITEKAYPYYMAQMKKEVSNA